MSGRADAAAGLDRRLVLLLAVTCGAAVANLYYAQPLLSTLGHALGVSDGTAGLLVTASQAGYVAGLALLVPLGDLVERRRLICATALVTAAAEAAAAAAPSFWVLAGLLVLVGVSSTVAQVVVPMASHLAAADERGRVVGTVMSGLLVGILLARTVSGLLAGAFGWRTVFAVAAVAMLVLSATLWRALPRVAPTVGIGYGAALRSVGRLVAREPVLRQRMLLGALNFGIFSALWTSLAFLLAGPHYHYGNATIGLFGLAGAAGACAAPIAGRLADRGHARRASTGAFILLLASWGALAAGGHSVIALIAGIVALDLASQAAHISNQSTIYALDPEARSRLTTAYMVSCFLGATAFSAIASALSAAGGWGAVCLLGAGTAAVVLLTWAVSERRLLRVAVVEQVGQPVGERGPARASPPAR